MNRRLALIAAALARATAVAQHAGHGAPARGEAASTREFRAVNAAMHRGMDIRYSGNADGDFLAGMYPHHAGAIEMVGIVLRHDTAPEVKRLAEEIVTAQQAMPARLPAR